MQIQYICGVWGMEELPLEIKLNKIKQGGFDGVEIGVPADNKERKLLKSILKDLDLSLVAQILTAGSSPQEHAKSYEEQFIRSVELEPVIINSHTGKDYFTLEDNVSILETAEKLEDKYGVKAVHEIHRGRATFSINSTMALLTLFPGLKLTADFSHWAVVHESLLEDQEESVNKAIRISHHIHARVGHAEGPQVSDPRAPEWKYNVDAHINWWQKIVDHHIKTGSKLLTICPEFGPPAYMPTLPYTRQPVADQWELNTYMLELLQEKLKIKKEKGDKLPPL